MTTVGDYQSKTMRGLAASPPKRPAGERCGAPVQARVPLQQEVENALGSRGAIERVEALVVEAAQKKKVQNDTKQSASDTSRRRGRSREGRGR